MWINAVEYMSAGIAAKRDYQMKAKFFSATANNYSDQKAAYPPGSTLEDEVNAWLLESPSVKVIHIKQSTGGSSFWSAGHVFVSVWYEGEEG
jgi:hypothetical protein